ncbi:transcription factor IIF subunit tfg1 [Ceratocystis pirilliformis]|uniref:Transcription factor IIF subunit tfg1 n=1 Tax=Ceratocystis pirilliformis TaxID=259994 RepID=A0ABR3ZEB9_9PEZI
MSAPPPSGPPQPMSTPTPNGALNGSQGLPARRPPPQGLRPPRRRPADPMVARKRPNAAKQIGFRKMADSTSMDRFPTKSLEDLQRRRQQYDGWSEPPPNVSYADYPVVTTKRELREHMRIHAMRFIKSKGGDDSTVIDPTNQNEFTRPVTLHRRDPRQPPPGRAPPKEPTPEPVTVDEKESERLAQLKADKEAQRAIDQAKIAPGIKEQKQSKQKPKEEKINLNRMPTTAKGKKQSDIRYEEALPWHLEDADGKNVWVGSYESALSESYVALLIDGNKFRMIPIEKWYKFTAKPPFVPISADQAEDMLRKQIPVTRWLMKKEEEKAEGQKRMQEFRAASGPAKRRRPDQESRDYDEVDMDPGDEFQDDDETGGVLDFDDEDAKISSERIRKNQLGANLFGDGDEKDVDEKESVQMRDERIKREQSRKLKKKFLKRVNENAIESDDSDSDPFLAQASSANEDSDEEEEEKKEEEKQKDKPEDEGEEDKTKGSETSNAKKAVPDPLKKKSLKRAGSPGASESSGNESSRKKSKIKKIGVAGQSRASTPLASTQRRKVGGAANLSDDGEATAGEMSDSHPRKKIRIIGNKPVASGSRAGSPVPPIVSIGPIQPQEIIAALPELPDGITILNLFKSFDDRVGDRPGLMSKSDWLKLVRENSQYGQDKLLRRKE